MNGNFAENSEEVIWKNLKEKSQVKGIRRRNIYFLMKLSKMEAYL